MALTFSIDKKLIVLVMVVAGIAISITAFLSFNYADEILRDRTGDQLISESTVRGNSIELLFETRIKETQILANDPMIQILVDELNQASKLDVDEQIQERQRAFLIQVQAFQELVGFSIGLEDVKIIGKDGIVHFSLGRLTNENYLEDPLFLKGMQKPLVDFEPGGQDARRMIVVTPIFEKDGKRDTEPIGLVVARMRTAVMDEILLNRSGLGQTGEVYLVNKDYLMISPSRFLDDVVFKQTVDTIPVKSCFDDGTEVVGIYPDYRGISIYGSSFCAADKGFVLLAEIDESETVQPILVLQERIFQSGLIITAGVAILALILSKTFSQPLIKLRNAANEIAEGNYDVKTNIETQDEIGDLSTSFDYMAKRLKESILEIKEKEKVIKQQEDILLQFSDYSEKYCVCMADVMNSTKLTANLSDSQTSEFYRIFLNSIAVIVRDFDGIVVKNIGDALLFSFPQRLNENVFKTTLECCLKIAESSNEIKEKMKLANLPTCDYRVSATYGPVRIARLSTSSVNDIFGTTVNRCAKINRSGPANGVIIGQEFYEKAKTLEDYTFKKIAGDIISEEFGFSAYSVFRKNNEDNH